MSGNPIRIPNALGNKGNVLAGKYAKFRAEWFKLVTAEKFGEVVKMHLERLLEPNCPPQVLALFYKYCMGEDPVSNPLAANRTPEELYEHVRRMIRERDAALLSEKDEGTVQ